MMYQKMQSPPRYNHSKYTPWREVSPGVIGQTGIRKNRLVYLNREASNRWVFCTNRGFCSSSNEDIARACLS